MAGLVYHVFSLFYSDYLSTWPGFGVKRDLFSFFERGRAEGSRIADDDPLVQEKTRLRYGPAGFASRPVVSPDGASAATTRRGTLCPAPMVLQVHKNMEKYVGW